MTKCTHCRKRIWFWQKVFIDSGFNLHANCVHDFYGWERIPKKDIKALCDAARRTNEMMAKRMEILRETFLDE